MADYMNATKKSQTKSKGLKWSSGTPTCMAYDPPFLLYASPPSIETSAPPKNDNDQIVGYLLPQVSLQPTEKSVQAVFDPYISIIDYSD